MKRLLLMLIPGWLYGQPCDVTHVLEHWTGSPDPYEYVITAPNNCTAPQHTVDFRTFEVPDKPVIAYDGRLHEGYWMGDPQYYPTQTVTSDFWQYSFFPQRPPWYRFEVEKFPAVPLDFKLDVDNTVSGYGRVILHGNEPELRFEMYPGGYSRVDVVLHCNDTTPSTTYEIVNVCDEPKYDQQLIDGPNCELRVIDSIWVGQSFPDTSYLHDGYLAGDTTRHTRINAWGCEVVEHVQIWLEPEQQPYVPNIFSPNRDGRNDVFAAYFGMPIKFSIFDRYGDEVAGGYSASGVVEWDGTFNGHPLNPGTYFYIITTERNEKFGGDITIIK